MLKSVRLHNAYEVIDTLKDDILIESAANVKFVRGGFGCNDLLLTVYYDIPSQNVMAHIDVTSCISNLVNKDSEIEVLTNKGRKVLLWLVK